MIVKKFIKRLFRCPADRRFFMVWVEKTANNDLGQIEMDYRIYAGRHVILSWLYIYTPTADIRENTEHIKTKNKVLPPVPMSNAVLRSSDSGVMH
jgi:hypothetical protein